VIEFKPRGANATAKGFALVTKILVKRLNSADLVFQRQTVLPGADRVL